MPSTLFLVPSLAILLFTLVGKLGPFFWFFDLFSHFAVQYLFAGIVLLVIAIIWNRKNLGALALLSTSIVLNIVSLAPLYRQAGDPPASGSNIRISSININSINSDWPALSNYLENYKPDVVAFFELTPEWGNKLNTLQQVFPYGKAVLQNDNFGIGIISRIPLHNIEIRRETSFGLPFIAADIELMGDQVTIVAAHPFPPIGAIGTRIRDEYLAQVGEFIRNKTSPTILCGDLNITPWSSHFRSVAEVANLSLAKGHGVVTTWPTYIPFLRIPIDHCLASASIRFLDYARGPHIGSDHYPLEATITLDSERIPASK